jgi:predicted RNA-binding Zn-ribbon protein involved in translation (DUF1610 family)
LNIKLMKTLYACPACGVSSLVKIPWYQKTLANGEKVWRTSHEICSSCGIEFGRDDYAGGDPEARQNAWAQWRKRWQKRGSR